MSFSGRLFNVQHFSVHDGPGIRTTAFLQGCPLNCLWCHNPEGVDDRMQFLWYEERCTRCEACVRACPVACLHVDEAKVLRRELERCIECGACARACHYGALETSGSLVTAEALADLLLADYVFYEVSGGGVTFSGGEPLMQAEFVAETAKILKERRPDLHIALDTCGAVPWSKFEAVLPYVDLFLYDIKHADMDVFYASTGGSLALVLNNLKRLSDTNARIDLRVPLIKGYNMDKRFAEHLLALVADYKIGRLHLIPYHAHGEKKYERLGIERAFDQFDTPDQDELNRFKGYLSDHVEVVIGG